MGGWKDEYNDVHGIVSYHYTSKDWTETAYIRTDYFTLTFGFEDTDSLAWLPSKVTVGNLVEFNDPSDPFAGGGVFDKKGEIIGWVHCEHDVKDRRICTTEFRGERVMSDGSNVFYMWLRLRKTFGNNGDVCFLSGQVRMCYSCNEDYIVWHSKRLCN